MSILGNRIKRERENLGLTREEFANKIGVSYSAIAMYERGEREPNNTLTIKMCELFNCSTDYLIGKSEYRNEDDFFSRNMKLAKEFIEFGASDESDFMDMNKLDALINKLSKLDEEKFEIVLRAYINTLPKEYQAKVENYVRFLCSYSKNFYSTENNLLSNETLSSTERDYYMCPVYGQISAGQPNWAEENIEGRLMIDPDLMGIVNPEEHFFLRVNGESMNKIVRNGAFALIHKQDFVENGEIAVVLVNGFDATLKKFTKQNDLIILEPQSNDESFETQVYDKTTPIKILGKYVGKMEVNK